MENRCRLCSTSSRTRPVKIIIKSAFLNDALFYLPQYVHACCGFYFQIYPNCFGYIYLWRDFMHYFWIVFPAILPISMIIRGVLAFRCRLNKELYGTTNKNGFEKVSEFTLPTELHNKKNIEISKLLRGYWLLVIGLILFVCWLIFAYVYTFNVQATSKLSIVSLVLYVVEMIINAIIVKRTAPHLE